MMTIIKQKKRLFYLSKEKEIDLMSWIKIWDFTLSYRVLMV